MDSFSVNCLHSSSAPIEREREREREQRRSSGYFSTHVQHTFISSTLPLFSGEFACTYVTALQYLDVVLEEEEVHLTALPPPPVPHDYVCM